MKLWKFLIFTLLVFDVVIHHSTSASLFDALVPSTTESHITNFLHQPRADSRADKPKESNEYDSDEDNEIDSIKEYKNSSSPATVNTSSNDNHNHHLQHKQSEEEETPSNLLEKLFGDLPLRIEDAINVISDRQNLPIHFNIPNHHHHHHHSHHSQNHTHNGTHTTHRSQPLLPFNLNANKTQSFATLFLTPLLNLFASASRNIDIPTILRSVSGGQPGSNAVSKYRRNKKRDVSHDEDNGNHNHEHHDEDDEHNFDLDHDTPSNNPFAQHIKDKAKTLASFFLAPILTFLADSSRNVDVTPILGASSGGANAGAGQPEIHENHKRESDGILQNDKDDSQSSHRENDRPLRVILKRFSNLISPPSDNHLQTQDNTKPVKENSESDILSSPVDNGGIDDDQLDYENKGEGSNLSYDEDNAASSATNQTRMVPTETVGIFILELIGTIAGLTWGAINQIQNILRPRN